MAYTNSTGKEVAALGILPDFSLWMSSSGSSSIFFIVSSYKLTDIRSVSLSSVSCSSKLTKPEEGISDVEPRTEVVGDLGTYNLRLAPEVGWEQNYGTKLLTPGI